MADLLTLAAAQPALTLEPNEALIKQGETGGNLYVLESGELSVERDGIAVTTISRPNTLVGEMSVLLGTPNSATVRATETAVVRVVPDARARLMEDPELTFRLAALVAARLDATTALLVQMSKDQPGAVGEGVLGRIFSALHLPASPDADDYIVDPVTGLFAALPPAR